MALASVQRLCRTVLIGLALCCCRAWADDPGANTSPTKAVDAADKQSRPELFRGRVVYLKEALEKRDIETADETAKHVVLETDAGELIPILSDWRGRAFYQDEHLRDREVELIGFRHAGVPYLNVIAVYTFDDGGQRMYTDYWCDICSIPMYEIQACECCQGPIQLRFQPQKLPAYINETPSVDDSPTDPGTTK